MSVSYTTYVGRLQGDYLRAFQKAEVFAVSLDLDDATLDDQMMELLDVLLTAQKQGKSVERVLGNDLDAFCEHYFETVKWRGMGQRMLDWLYQILWLVLLFAAFTLLINVVVGELSIAAALSSSLNVAGYVIGLLCGAAAVVLLRFLLRPILIRMRKMTAILYNAAQLALMLVFVMAGNEVLHHWEMTVPRWGIIVLCLALIVMMTVIRRNGEPSRPDKPSAAQAEREKAETEAPVLLRKRYERINARRAKAGRESISPEEFTLKIRRDHRASGFATPVLMLLLAVVILPTLVKTFTEAGLWFGLLHVLLLTAVEFPLYWIMRGDAAAHRVQGEMLAECDRRGISLIELIEERIQASLPDATNQTTEE